MCVVYICNGEEEEPLSLIYFLYATSFVIKNFSPLSFSLSLCMIKEVVEKYSQIYEYVLIFRKLLFAINFFSSFFGYNNLGAIIYKYTKKRTNERKKRDEKREKNKNANII